jgi:hypothetical protein
VGPFGRHRTTLEFDPEVFSGFAQPELKMLGAFGPNLQLIDADDTPGGRIKADLQVMLRLYGFYGCPPQDYQQ